MSAENAAGIGRWREGKRTRKRPDRGGVSAKKWMGTMLLTVLLVLTAGGLSWIVWQLVYPREISPEFVPIFITRFKQPQIPTIPQAAADRDRIRQATFLDSINSEVKADDGLTLEVIQDRLDRLVQKKADDEVLVYLSTRAVVDGEGTVQILAYDSDPFVAKTLLPFKAVLTALKQCPARRKLLVLDLIPDRSSPLELGGTEDGIADLISKELTRSNGQGRFDDPHLAVLVACSPGEVALWSEPLRQSVFGHFFVQALNDPEADTDSDHAVSLQELSKYLPERVDAWARQHRALRQRPMMIGSTEFFSLSSLNRRKPQPQNRTEQSAKDEEKKKLAARSESSSEKVKESEKKKAEDEGQLEKKTKAKDTAEHDTDERTSGPVYPLWLAKGWELRERWANGPEIMQAPRLFRQLEANLLRHEEHWRLGNDPKSLESALERTVSALAAKMEQERRENRPPERSVGQALAWGKIAEQPLVKSLKEILDRERRPDPLANADQRKAQRTEMVGALLKSLKDKTSLDLTMSIVEAATDARLDIETVQLLDSIISVSALPRNIIELRLLQQLADRARKGRREDWDDDLTKKIWDTVLVAERANNRPGAFLWLRGLLDEADGLRHEAEVLLLPQAFGYTSARQLARSWEAVAQAFSFIDDSQARIGEAQKAIMLARAALPAYLPFLESSTSVQRSALWLDTARTVQAVDDLLEKTDLTSESPAPTRDQLEQLNSLLTEKTQELRRQLVDLFRPFRAESVQRLIASCEENLPDPRLGQEIEALLQTPFLKGSDRQALWKASLALDRRLGELADRDGGATTDLGTSADRLLAVKDLVTRRKQRLLALLRLADPKSTVSELEPGADPSRIHARADGPTESGPPSAGEPLAQVWRDLARYTRSVHSRITDALHRGEREPGDDRPALIVPALMLDEGHNPIRQGRDRERRAAWTWLASRYQHESRDLQGLLDSSGAFFEAASIEVPRASEIRPEPSVKLSLPEQVSNIRQLSSSQPTIDVDIQLTLGGTDAGTPEKVTIAVLETDDPRLRASKPQPAELELSSASAKLARLHVEWDETKGNNSKAPPAGIIVQARLPSGRAFHLLVPIEIVPAQARPRLALRVDPTQAVDVPCDPLRLRTLPDKQPYFVVVKNPSSVDRKVIVDVMAGDSMIASSSEKDKPPLEVKSGSTLVASFGDPTGKPTDPLPESPQNLSLRLRDAASGQEYERLVVRPVIAAPLEYIEIATAQFTPPRRGESNRLDVELRSLPQMTGPPCPIKLELPSDPELFPGFVEPPRGKLEGRVDPGGKSLRLFAEDIRLKPIVRDEALFSLSVDGIARALWYQTRFVPEGQAQKVEPVQKRRVRFQPTLSVQPDKPAKLTVHFQVDNAPPDAILEFRLGHFERGEFKPDIKDWSDRAQPRHIGFDPRGKGGAALFEASVGDWNRDFEVPGIRGRKLLYAFLLDANGRTQLDKWGMELVLDDVPPQVTHLEVPVEIDATTTRVNARANVKPTESGVKDVRFIVNGGGKGDFAKADAENKTIPGKPSAGDPNTWEASLPVPQGASGKLVVSARATSGVGLTGFAHGETTIREPAPQPAPAATKPVEDKPGTIQGKVTENDVAQPNLTVYLINPKAKDNENPYKDEKKTNPDGTYTFSDVKPGLYRLYCVKDATGRRAIKDVLLESGKTVGQDLDLLLP
jgi:hypothetical protein